LNFFFQLKKVQLKKKKSILAIQMGCRQLTYYSETADNKGIHTTLKIIWKNCTGHYTYDIHGNVDTLLQDNQQLSLISTALQPQRFKKIIYDYDLISDNMNLVSYQDGQPDAFYHFYEYDADNRIIAVYSSNYPQANNLINLNTVTNSPLWDNDAKYFYYAHGPLSRVEYGDNKVQGQDYVYTLQGWMKGLNSNTLDTARDIGKDGAIGSINSIFAKDAFGYTLNYHANDYNAIDGFRWNNANNRFESIIAGSDLNNSRTDLFNGNITSMVTTIEKPMIYTAAANQAPTVMAQGTAYKYDQLNRLKEMKAFANLDFTTNTWQGGSTYSGMYHNRFNFDANGNIQWQQRADSTGSIFDELTYRYELDPAGRLERNRLYHVNDSAANNLAIDDIKDEGVFTANADTINDINNYRYDEIGELIHDSQEQIDSITWTVYGKIKKIIRTDTSSKPDFEFNYDAIGNRISKVVKPHGTSADNGGTDIPTQWTSTYYVRDAEGNIMTTYKLAAPANASSFKVIERNIFGTSRLGTDNTQIELISALPTTNPYARTLGHKHYETSNHLGNVLTVFTDRKIPVTSDGSTIDHFDADVVNTFDYSPFGAPMNERTYRLAHVFTDTTHTDTVWAYVNGNTPLNLIADDSTKYRYGFNGMEKVDEVSGNGNHYTAEFWEYDPRTGLRWNTDPLAYPWQSPYVCFNNNPIVFTDPLGLFGSRKEAREYKKEHGLKGRIQKGDDGIFAINNKKEGTSYFKDPSLDDVPNLAGRQEDGVIKSAMVTPEESNSPSAGAYSAGLEEFGERGGKLKVSTEPLNSTGKIKYYDNAWGGNQYTKTKNLFNKGLTKGIAKHAPIIGHILDAKEVIDGIQADGNALGANAAIEIAGVAGGAGGAWAGASAGAAVGSLIFPGVGTVVGGVVGGVLGSWGGEAAAESATKRILKEE